VAIDILVILFETIGN